MPLPLAHSLVGAAIVAATRDEFSFRQDWGRMMLGAAIAVVPDFDLVLSWIMGYGLKWHGGFSHSIVFGLALGSIAALLAREESVKGVLGYYGAALSHALLDTATKKEFGGSELLWPLSAYRFKLGIVPDYEFYPDPKSQSIKEILIKIAEFSYYELWIYLPLFLLIVFLKSYMDKRQLRMRRDY